MGSPRLLSGGCIAELVWRRQSGPWGSQEASSGSWRGLGPELLLLLPHRSPGNGEPGPAFEVLSLGLLNLRVGKPRL